MKLSIFLASFAVLIPVVARAVENEIGFIEKFALAPDRSATLGQLVPGSEDYYFFSALHFQSSGQKAKLAEIMDQWKTRFPDSQRRREIESRSTLLDYGNDSASTLKFLKERLSLEFNDEREVADQEPASPTTLDPKLIARDAFLQKALEDDGLGRFSDASLEALVRDKVTLRPAQLRTLLGKLKRPDLPGLVELVAADLKTKESRGFGEFPIHGLLLPEQLEDLAKRIPALADNQAFVVARLKKILPSADADMELDPKEKLAWLDRAWTLVSKLTASFNTLKAQILFQRLQFDRTHGLYDKARFLEYLKLPRRADYVNPEFLRRSDNQRATLVDFNSSPKELEEFIPRIVNDEPLVRDFLLQLLANEDSWELWAVWLRDSYLKPLFAEAKIVNGIGDPEKWASLLSPTAFQALRDRVDVDFAPTNAPLLAPADAVTLNLFIKNTPKLIVKIYEVNTLSYFLTQKQQLNTDLNLDGLVANRELTQDLSADEAGRNPFRRVARKFEFPELKGKRGAWVIEFIGGGKSSRALIRKGQWQILQQTGPAGDMLTVIDEALHPVQDAVVWLDGRKFTPDTKTSFVVVPFTGAAQTKPIVLADPAGEFATLTTFEHHQENYHLSAQFHIEREELLAGRTATVAVQTALLLDSTPVPLTLLQDPQLTLTTTTLDGVSTTQEIKNLKLTPGDVFTSSFPVPERLASVKATISGSVENLSAGGTKEAVSEEHEFTLNGIDRTPLVADGHLSKFGENYIFELLGKNGEPQPGGVVSFAFSRRDFDEEIQVQLHTDSQGRIALGTLSGIFSLKLTLPNGILREWTLLDDQFLRPSALQGKAGEVLRIPWMKGNSPLQPQQVSLLELRGETFVQNRFSALALAGGFLEIRGLPAGNYSLRIAGEEDEIPVRLAAGTVEQGWVLGPNRQLEASNPAPVQIESTSVTDDALTVQLRNVNPLTRLHVAAARFIPIDEEVLTLGNFDVRDLAEIEPSRRPNLFVAGRAIGDEYRYILERRYAKTFPGNLLTRPGLLLNPWEIRSTELNAQTMTGADALGRSAGDRESRKKTEAAEKMQNSEAEALGPGAADTQNLDFLASAAPVLYNLVPDKDGVVRIDRKALGDRQYVQLVAADSESAVWRFVTLPEVPTKFQDLRLARGLDPAKAFSEKKQVSLLTAGQALTLADLVTSELETYDSLASIHALFTTLHPDVSLAKFAFILQWPKLSDAEKRAKYSEFACHELNFFLSRKDPDFFQKVVQPYLRNKKDKTFLDDYLLGTDLHRYLEPWAYAQLNAVERCLLAQRVPGETTATARRLKEQWEMLPVNPTEQDRLFDTALRGRALAEGEDGSDFKGAKDKAMIETSSAPEFTSPQIPSSFGMVTRSMAGAAADAPVNAPASPKPMALAAVVLADNAEAEPEAVAKKKSLSEEDTQRLRKEVRQYFRLLGPTKEWAENNYYQLPLAQQTAELVPVNAFWRDYAAWDGKAPFLSEHVAEAGRNFTEAMLALAVLDLPFEPAKHTTKTEGAAYTLTAGSALIAFQQQIKPAAPAPTAGNELLVSQNFYRADARYREEGNEKFDNYVTGEFLSGVVYGANIVVTNPSSAPQKIELLLQIPRGALPVQGSKPTDSRRVRLEPYTTQTFEYFFYFPSPAEQPFAHYPVNVSRNETVAGAAKPVVFKVVKQLSEVDKTSWDYVSQNGTEAEVFAFLGSHNLERLDLSQIAWRARQSADFFRRLTTLLGQAHVWSEPIYRYAVLHNDAPTLREWLRHRDDFLAECGPALESKLLTIDPIERRAYEHLEYSPLINQRAHRIGAENTIPNPVLRAQYQHLLDILAHRSALDDADRMSLVYYLFLQDRVEEALTLFHQIKPDTLPTRLQYDYFRCYAAFYEAQPAAARPIAAQYATYPVERWRKLFAEVTAQLDEIEGKTVARLGEDQPDREKQQAELAASEPSFDFKVENRSIALTWKNLAAVTINYYPMDPEFLFSASPFVTQDSGRFSVIKPTQSTTQTLPAVKDALDLPLPEAFAKANVLVEILAAGQRKAQAYHANTFKLNLAENYGRLEALDQATSRPVPQAYVKVYARLRNGTVRFFKDGYTDLRGKFDYASLNSSTSNPGPIRPPRPLTGGASGLDYQMIAPSQLNDVERLAILVLSDANGTLVREVTPPSK